MAKGKNNPAPAEDYIAQLEWQAQHRRHVPVRFEPRWKYKIVYRYHPTTLVERIAGLVLFVSVLIGVVSFLSSNTSTIGARIFFGVVIGLIFLIVLFAVRDASDDEKRDDLNS